MDCDDVTVLVRLITSHVVILALLLPSEPALYFCYIEE